MDKLFWNVLYIGIVHKQYNWKKKKKLSKATRLLLRKQGIYRLLQDL